MKVERKEPKWNVRNGWNIFAVTFDEGNQLNVTKYFCILSCISKFIAWVVILGMIRKIATRTNSLRFPNSLDSWESLLESNIFSWNSIRKIHVFEAKIEKLIIFIAPERKTVEIAKHFIIHSRKVKAEQGSKWFFRVKWNI